MKPSPRILELAQRLVAAGPKCNAVSASETHEITDFILSLDDDKSVIASNTPEGGEAGLSVEHILLSVTVVHTNRIMQYWSWKRGAIRTLQNRHSHQRL